MVAQGSKPVGGIDRVVSGQESTIGVIQLDEVAKEQLTLAEEENDLFDEEDDKDDKDDKDDNDDITRYGSIYIII